MRLEPWKKLCFLRATAPTECFSAEFYNKSIIRKNNLVFNACKFVTLKYTTCSGYSWFPLIWGEAHPRIGGSKLRQVILRFCFITEALRLSFCRLGSHYSHCDSAGNGNPTRCRNALHNGNRGLPQKTANHLNYTFSSIKHLRYYVLELSQWFTFK